MSSLMFDQGGIIFGIYGLTLQVFFLLCFYNAFSLLDCFKSVISFCLYMRFCLYRILFVFIGVDRNSQGHTARTKTVWWYYEPYKYTCIVAQNASEHTGQLCTSVAHLTQAYTCLHGINAACISSL